VLGVNDCYVAFVVLVPVVGIARDDADVAVIEPSRFKFLDGSLCGRVVVVQMGNRLCHCSYFLFRGD